MNIGKYKVGVGSTPHNIHEMKYIQSWCMGSTPTHKYSGWAGHCHVSRNMHWAMQPTDIQALKCHFRSGQTFI